jgi:hypothetical protein
MIKKIIPGIISRVKFPATAAISGSILIARKNGSAPYMAKASGINAINYTIISRCIHF